MRSALSFSLSLPRRLFSSHAPRANGFSPSWTYLTLTRHVTSFPFFYATRFPRAISSVFPHSSRSFSSSLFYSSSSNPSSSSSSSSSNHHPSTPSSNPSKLRTLITKYGKTALLLYLALTTLDLALCYVVVQRYPTTIFLIEDFISKRVTGGKFELGGVRKGEEGGEGHEQERKPGFMATFAIAYAVHKLLVPVRVPLTAALTPITARWLARRGWVKVAGK